MTELVEILQSPLDQSHVALGATMIKRDGWRVPATYGNDEAEYAAVRDGGAGLIDLSPRGRILVGGSEAVQFLNGLITNDMKTLAEGSWMPAAFPNVQGRLIASVRVVRLKDEGEGKNVSPTYLLDTEATTHQSVLKTIERFTLAGDFRVTDITNETAELSLQGSNAANLLRSVMGEVAELAPNGAMVTLWHESGVTVVRASHTTEDGFDLILDSKHAVSLWRAFQEAGARPVGHNALEILRIEAGLPRFGIDMDESNIVTESNLDDAVSFTKGCYVGQEIIARIKYRGHVAKKLVGLTTDEAVKLQAGSSIKSIDEKDIGRITSAIYSPRLDRTIALAYVKYDYLTPGTAVKVVGSDVEVAAQVTELPFVRGSWFEQEQKD
ncbi:MAG: aminomethyltransferase family protein [Acidobacteriota bacterium]|nr:aminomethyltransferase family protein [Acidobacteriota bacterium]